MSANNKISNLVYSQLPFFVRNDHPNFVAFLEAYYEYLEQDVGNNFEGRAIQRGKSLPDYVDIDKTIDIFADKLFWNFLNAIPRETLADKTKLIKNIQHFYRARGTEKASKFLMNILFNKELDFYYPKADVLRTSDGKWFIERSLTLTDLALNNVSNNLATTLDSFTQKMIFGKTSKSVAVVDRTQRTIVDGQINDKLFISYVKGRFKEGEEIYTQVPFGSNVSYLSANITSNSVLTIAITDKGSLYNVGDYVIFETANSENVTPANAQVSIVSKGELFDFTLIKRGAGFQTGNPISFIEPYGSGATGSVTSVSDNNYYHPNTYNLISSTISLEANTLLSGIFANLNTSIIANPDINSPLYQVLDTTQIAGLGPIDTVVLSNGGLGYRSSPVIDVQSNSLLRELGILGRMEIVAGGKDYQIGDTLVFTNPTGYPGFGATGNVRNVSVTGAITEVQFTQYNNELIGGSGYIDPSTKTPKFPDVSVVSTFGTGASIRVIALMGDGENIYAANNTMGAIEKITINDSGANYIGTPTINLSASGDGTAKAYAVMSKGFEEYEGRFLDDDGFVSSFNFLQDRDFYQNYSYVMIIKENIKNYRDAVKALLHPAGMRLFGEYDFTATVVENSLPIDVVNMSYSTEKLGTFSYANGSNVVELSVKSHGYVANDNVYLDFVDTSEFTDKYYMVRGVSNANSFNVSSTIFATANGSGQVIIYNPV